MKRYSKVIAIGIAAAFAAAMPGISSAKAVQHYTTTSAQVVVHDNDVAPMLAVLVGGLVLASAIHASQQCEPVVVAGPVCPPRYQDCDERGDWHRDRGWHGDHGRGHGRGHDRGWERHRD